MNPETLKTNNRLELAFNFVKYTGANIFLTGKAGTGKTTFLKQLKQQSPKRMIVVAPTGVAAINAGGVTIHSFFQLSFGVQMGEARRAANEQRFTSEKIKIMRSLDLLVIDEISMVRVDVLDAIDRTLRRFRKGSKPFGGVQVLMIGDLQQLAPVVKSEEWGLLKQEYETPYFFSSKVLKESPYICIELTEVFRQQDERFVELLNKVRDNVLDEAALTALNARYIPNFEPDDEEGYIFLCTHNYSAQRINESKLTELPGRIKRFMAQVKGKFPEYSYPTDFELVLKEGAQVMFVKNDVGQERRFFNGKIGRITRIEDEAVFVQCPGENEEIEVEAQTWENFSYKVDPEKGEIREELEGSFTQIPLKLAWAITIHKSQGLTFEKAIIDAAASFAHGQVYVALSRCKSLEGMVLSSQISKQSVINDSTVSGFVEKIEELHPDKQALNQAMLAFQKEKLTELFNFNRLAYLLRAAHKLAKENAGAFPPSTLEALSQLTLGFETEVSEVSEKFHDQIMDYLRREPDTSKNMGLQERVKKAAVYFGEKLEEWNQSLGRIDFDVDNKAIKKQMGRYWGDWDEEFEQKTSMLEVCREGFDVGRMMDAGARTMLKSVKKTKPGKAPKLQDYSQIEHPELFQALREYRSMKAAELEVPPYQIFSQKVLYELVAYLPGTTSELKTINGMGAKRIERFGKDILEIIVDYASEYGVEIGKIPLEKTLAREEKPKADTRKVSFELFMAGKSIADIARERALTEGTIQNHLAFFVARGELDIDRLMEPDKRNRIAAYFEKADDCSFSAAKAYFGEEASYAELRLVASYLESLNKERGPGIEPESPLCSDIDF